jgi:hypothetical protein
MKIEYIEQLSQLSNDDADLKLSPKIPSITPQVESGGAQLNDILNSGDGGIVYAPVKTIENQSVGWLSDYTNTLTSTLIQKADDLGASFRSKLDHVTELIKEGPDTLSLQSVMAAQIEMHSVTLEMDLISNGVHKTTQYIDQLSKIS